jgi:hypothetical protein
MKKIESRKKDLEELLPKLLRAYKGLINEGCMDRCNTCVLNKVLVRSRVEYEYGEGKLIGTLSICDLLGVILEESGVTLLS